MVVVGSSCTQILISDANKSLVLLKLGQTFEPAAEKGTISESIPFGRQDIDQGVPYSLYLEEPNFEA